MRHNISPAETNPLGAMAKNLLLTWIWPNTCQSKCKCIIGFDTVNLGITFLIITCQPPWKKNLINLIMTNRPTFLSTLNGFPSQIRSEVVCWSKNIQEKTLIPKVKTQFSHQEKSLCSQTGLTTLGHNWSIAVKQYKYQKWIQEDPQG